MAPDGGQTVLEVQDLNLEIGKKKILERISFSVSKGESIGVVGRTGSGKTLLFSSALGIVPHNAVVHFQKIKLLDSEAPSSLMPKKAALVFQNSALSLNPIIKCGRQIQRILIKQLRISKKEAKERTLDLLSEVEIVDPERVYESYPHEISGGEAQRIMIAMGLSCEPEILILDEPTASLDKIVQSKLIQILAKLKLQRRLTLLVISHDLEMLGVLSDRIIHVHAGKIVEDSDVKNYFESPSSKEAKEIVASLKTYKHGSFCSRQTGITLINMERASFAYPNGVRAFSNIDLKINEKDFLGIIGESGSGKSTLGKCIAGILSLQGLHDTPDITYVFQDSYSSMDPDLTVDQIINEVIDIRRTSLSVSDLLKEVCLPLELSSRKIDQLSGGQRQRVNLARALATRPKILICDEITSGLDLSIQLEIIELLNERMADLTIVFITHDISLVKFFCNKVAIMKDGEIVEQGNTKEIFTNSKHDYTKTLINSLPKVKYFLNI